MALHTGRDRILGAVVAACMGAAVAVPQPARSAAPAGWGAFDGLAGSCWAGPSELSCFEWEMPGETLRQVTLGARSEQVVSYRLDVDGAGVAGDDGSRLHAPRANVTVRELATGAEPMRVVYRLQGDRLDISVERQAAGSWVQARAEQRTRATPGQVAQANAAVQAFRDEQRGRWGVLADLAGRRFVLPGRAGYLFAWADAGRVLRFLALHEDGQGDKVREITYDPDDDVFVAATKYRSRASGTWIARGDPEQGLLLADGGFYLLLPEVRIGQDAAGNLTMQPGKARRSTRTFEPEGPITVVSPASREAYAAMEERSRQAGERTYQLALANDRARAAQEAAGSQDSGLFGALVGAAMGVAAGSAAGLDSAQTLEVAMQGATLAAGSTPVGQGLARGWAEETAKQQAMQQGFDDAVDRGLAQGAAEYARRQRGGSYEDAGMYRPGSADVGGTAGSEPGADPGADQAADQAAAKPLRFVLMIGMRNLPGDRNNSMCYSNVITRPGPPGWGARGFLPSGSGEQALQQVQALKHEFIAACRRQGREITSEGNFRHAWNQSDDDEQRVQSTGPRLPEDISVVLN